MNNNKFSLKEIIEATDAKVIKTVSDSAVGISTDSRQENNGKVFFALKGDHFDAHDFLEQAVESGASILIVHKNQQVIEKFNVSILLVEDSLKALQDLAKYWRKKLAKPLIAITGTNGKTTTKEYLAQILSTNYNVCYSKGSFNNHWGLPLSILNLLDSDDYMISEMGMNQRGEIAKLCQIAEPDYTLVTNVGRGHLEGMKSIEQVAIEKEDIYKASPNSVKAFNLDNIYTQKMYEKYRPSRRFTFSAKNKDADVYLDFYKTAEGNSIKGHILGIGGEEQVKLFGKHNVYNVASAATLASAAGMDPLKIWQALPLLKEAWGRNQWVTLNSGAKVLFDAYNANPESMDVFFQNSSDVTTKGKRYYILGDMLELGSFNDKEHIELVKSLASLKHEKVYYFGKNASLVESLGLIKNLIVSDVYKESLANELRNMLNPEDVVFMKASRGIQLEKFLMDLEPLDFSLNK